MKGKIKSPRYNKVLSQFYQLLLVICVVKATIVHRFVCTALHYFAPPCLPAVLSSFVLGHSGAAMLCVPKDFGRLISPDGAEFTTGMKQTLLQMTAFPHIPAHLD